MNKLSTIEALASTSKPIDCNLCGGSKRRHLFTKHGYELVECADCALVYVGNPPNTHALHKTYSADADYHSELLDPDSASTLRQTAIARRHAAILRRIVRDGEGLRLLDIGCSAGFFLDEARKAGFAVEGVELSPDTAAFARDHFGLTVHTGTLDAAPLADSSFDVATLFDVIEHVPDPLGELHRIRRLLKPGGIVLQATPNIDGLFPRLSHKLANRLDYWPHPEPPHHLFQFSTRTLGRMLEKAGFEPIRTWQTRIDLDYSFGTLGSWKASPKLLAYAALFAPTAILGPWIGRGDNLYIAARKPAD
ncbi:MAG TPA: class I SAM-dependent methyltransferase [Novosphingobium sp.]|nr:class I SAM-dependent methyltransferase [Novosphingobium sp.]